MVNQATGSGNVAFCRAAAKHLGLDAASV